MPWHRLLKPSGSGALSVTYLYQNLSDVRVRDSDRTVRAGEHRLRVRAGALLARSPRLLLTIPLRYQRTELQLDCGASTQSCLLHRVQAGFFGMWLAAPRWGTYIRVGATLAGRAEHLFSVDALQPVASIGFNYLHSEELSILVGLTYSQSIGLPLPSIGVVWAPAHGRFRLEVLPPQRISVGFFPHPRITAILYLLKVDGGRFFTGENTTVLTPAGETGNDALQNFNLFSSARFNMELGGGVGLAPEVGLTWYSRVTARPIRSGGGRYRAVDTFEPRAGISIYWRPLL